MTYCGNLSRLVLVLDYVILSNVQMFGNNICDDIELMILSVNALRSRLKTMTFSDVSNEVLLIDVVF